MSICLEFKSSLIAEFLMPSSPPCCFLPRLLDAEYISSPRPQESYGASQILEEGYDQPCEWHISSRRHTRFKTLQTKPCYCSISTNHSFFTTFSFFLNLLTSLMAIAAIFSLTALTSHFSASSIATNRLTSKLKMNPKLNAMTVLVRMMTL